MSKKLFAGVLREIGCTTEDGEYFTLYLEGALIQFHIDKPMTFKEIVEKVAEEVADYQREIAWEESQGQDI